MSAKKSAIRRRILACSPVKHGRDFYRIDLVPEANWVCNQGFIGCVHWQERLIHLRERQDAVSLVDTLFHECVHLMISAMEGKIDREKTTKELETGFIVFFVDNPKLLMLFVDYCWNVEERKRWQETPK